MGKKWTWTGAFHLKEWPMGKQSSFLKMSPGKALETLPATPAFKSTAIFISSVGYLD